MNATSSAVVAMISTNVDTLLRNTLPSVVIIMVVLFTIVFAFGLLISGLRNMFKGLK